MGNKSAKSKKKDQTVLTEVSFKHNIITNNQGYIFKTRILI
jgi:hypothetical protein